MGLNELVKRAAEHGGVSLFVSRGGEALVRASDACRLVESFRSLGLAVIGVEGFDFYGDEIVPDMDCIADFSALCGGAWKDTQDRSISEALLFIKKIEDSRKFLAFTLQAVPDSTQAGS